MRRSNLLTRHLILSFLTVGLAGSFAHGQEYKIKFTRPEKVGDEWVSTVSATSSREATPTINGQVQPVNKDSFKVDLHGTIKVLAVNEKTGNAMKESCTVDTLTKDGADLYPAGTIIMVEKPEKKMVFTIDGSAVAAENAQLLELLFHVDGPDHTLTDDAQIGTEDPQKVGGSWPINAENSAKDAAEDGVTITPDNVKGESKLEEVKKMGETEVMVIKSTMTADGVKLDIPGAKMTDGKMTVEASFTLPTDVTAKMIKGTAKVHMTMSVALPNGIGQVSLVANREVSEERQPVKQ